MTISCDVLLHHSTLYCAKGNYEFGISRVIKSLEPYSRKVRGVPGLLDTMQVHVANCCVVLSVAWH